MPSMTFDFATRIARLLGMPIKKTFFNQKKLFSNQKKLSIKKTFPLSYKKRREYGRKDGRKEGRQGGRKEGRK